MGILNIYMHNNTIIFVVSIKQEINTGSGFLSFENSIGFCSLSFYCDFKIFVERLVTPVRNGTFLESFVTTKGKFGCG